ncbi:LOW QUALITY PROTEIN: FHF complex subunit HOOK-interacting protein 1B-like [Centruroides vittatus]|uniref:LOW QUALITY PROTEIN: FHF complex subunit HOOK-interacting protein 1B-like n=1 Tax=Centruroides vittatus TaxID=120091 RepID=UPI00350FA9E3
MSWFKRESPLRASFGRKSYTPPQPPDVKTCLEAFQRHWQQAWSVMEKTYVNPQFIPPTIDDVTSVINHFDQMVNLLLQEIVSIQQPKGQEVLLLNHNCITSGVEQPIESPILKLALSEKILDKLFAWSVLTGEYIDIMKIEQLKHYERLVSHSPQNLFHKPIVRPLLSLLASCTDCSPVEVEKRLVLLLNTLCVCLTKYPDLLKVFFDASPEQGSARFLIFSLLIPFVHREGAIGQQARDALLLCMALSRRNESIGMYIAEHSNFCPVLATGLSGLYSVLPRKLSVLSEDWYRFTPEDIQEMTELAMFLNSLEFCNAVIQVSHPMVQEQLLEYLYQGFLLPVLGPALHQSTMEEIVASTAYLELFLRTITEPTLLQVFLKYLLTESYEGHKILDTLISRIGAQPKLCLVTMALFWSLLDLNCEDVMLELVLKYLVSCTHIMVSQKTRIRDLDFYGCAADKFLSLIPTCCIADSSNKSTTNIENANVSLLVTKEALVKREYVSGSLRIKKHNRTPSTGSFAFGELDNIRYNTVNSPPLIKLSHFQTDYMDYLKDARCKIISCFQLCKCWSALYNGIDPPPDSVEKNSKSTQDTKFPTLTNNVCVTDHRNNNVTSNIFLSKKDSTHININKNFQETKDKETLENEENKNVQNGYTNGVLEHDGLCYQTIKKRPDSLEINRDLPFNQDIYQLPSIDDDQAFWSAVNSTKTPSSISDTEDILESYENNIESCMINTSPNLITDSVIREDVSVADSGAYMSQESTNSSLDRTSEINQIFEKYVQQKEEFLRATPIQTKMNQYHIFLWQRKHLFLLWESFGSPDIGPFLSILLTRLEMMMQNDVYTNLHLTGLFTRLAIYPQPLLRSFLLNHTLVFQPSIRSLLQVLVSLKHKIDTYSSTVENFEELLIKARQFLIAREERLLGDGPPRVYSETPTVKRRSNSDLQRGEPRRRSLTNILLRRTGFLNEKERTNTIKQPILESIPDGQGYRYISKPSPDAPEGKLETIKTKNAVLCAVVLEEFLKELAAITQEHGVIQLDPDFWDSEWEV